MSVERPGRPGWWVRQTEADVGPWRAAVGPETIRAIERRRRAALLLGVVLVSGILVVVVMIVGVLVTDSDAPLLGYAVWGAVSVACMARWSRADGAARRAVAAERGGISPWAARRTAFREPGRLQHDVARGRALSVGWTPSQAPPLPFVVRAAGWLAVVYGAGLVVYAVYIGWAMLVARIGPAARSGDPTVVRGSITVVTWLLVGALVLVAGGLSVRHGGIRAGLVGPLGALVLVGTIGESVDLAGTASGRDDAIGATIVLAAAVPVGLLLLPVARRWYRAKGTADGRLSSAQARTALSALPPPPPGRTLTPSG